MGLVDEVPEGSRIAFDTSALIYYIEEHPKFGPIVDPIFFAIGERAYSSVVSVVSLAETLVAPMRAGRDDLVERYRQLLTSTHGLALIPATPAVAEEAAAVRAAHNLRLPDALIAATATIEGCSHLIANDARFSAVSNFETLVISQFTDA